VASLAAVIAAADPLPPSATYRPPPTLPLFAVKANDEAEKRRSSEISRLCRVRYGCGPHGAAWSSFTSWVINSDHIAIAAVLHTHVFLPVYLLG
jgi:hypothetical protein